MSAGRVLDRKDSSPKVPDELAAFASNVVQDRDPTGFPKRTVALHVGYVGNSYRGLQISREDQGRQDLPPTVEEVLEKAILQAGFMRRENYGNFHKVHWSRSSRTDKGVHSLATVVSVKINCDSDHWREDPEGIVYAQAINRHLPSSMSVFSVQRVSDKFDGRSMCIARTYDYYLPGWILSIDPSDQDSISVALQRLSTALQHFVGSRPFHNYTKRRRYIPGQHKTQRWSKGKGKLKRSRIHLNDTTGGDGEGSDAGSDEEAADGAAAMNSSEAGMDTLRAAASSSTAGGSTPGDARAFAEPVVVMSMAAKRHCKGLDRDMQAAHGLHWRPFLPALQFLADSGDLADRVYQAHWREITSFDCVYLRVGRAAVPCVKLTVSGASFMFNQIRHMVGAAAATARGILPAEYIPASLSMRARCTVPLAPPCTLVLSGNKFKPFVKQANQRVPAHFATTGDTYSLQEKGRQLQASFFENELEAAVAELLADSCWQGWVAGLDHMPNMDQELEEWLGSYNRWQNQVANRRIVRNDKELV